MSRKSKCGAAAGLLFVALSLSSPALAQADYVGATPPALGSSDVGAAQRSVVQELDRAQSTGLAFTGGDILGLVVLGGVSVGTGAILVRRARPVAR